VVIEAGRRRSRRGTFTGTNRITKRWRPGMGGRVVEGRLGGKGREWEKKRQGSGEREREEDTEVKRE
jgi:hypothetical protein